MYTPLVDELLALRAIAADCLARYHENPVAHGSRGQQVYPELEAFISVSTRALMLAETL